MSTSRLVYRGLSRIVHQFKKDQIPLRGVVGQPWKAPTPDNISYLQSVFRTSAAVQPQSFDGEVSLRLSAACMHRMHACIVDWICGAAGFSIDGPAP